MLAVTVDRRGPSPEQREDEPRDHGRVMRERVLAGTEDVEIPEGHGLEPVDGVKRAAVALDRELRRDLSARVAFTSEATKGDSNRSRVLVPKPALAGRDGKSGVYLLVEGRAKFEPVETGGDVQGQIEVTKGLRGGERLIVLPEGTTLRDGDRVRVEGEKE